jgi:hypothetical protein
MCGKKARINPLTALSHASFTADTRISMSLIDRHTNVFLNAGATREGIS